MQRRISGDRISDLHRRITHELSGERAGLDDRHLDPKRADFLRETLRQTNDRKFARVVEPAAPEGSQASDARDRYDVSRALRP